MLIGTDEKIGRFDILVDNPVIMGILKCISSLIDKLHFAQKASCHCYADATNQQKNLRDERA